MTYNINDIKPLQIGTHMLMITWPPIEGTQEQIDLICSYSVDIVASRFEEIGFPKCLEFFEHFARQLRQIHFDNLYTILDHRLVSPLSNPGDVYKLIFDTQRHMGGNFNSFSRKNFGKFKK